MAGQDLEGRCPGLLSLDFLVQWGWQGPQELRVLQAPVSFPHAVAGIGEAPGLLKPGPGNPGSFPGLGGVRPRTRSGPLVRGSCSSPL